MNNTIVNIEMITVCDKCFRACCWQGEFMCEDSRTAGTVEKSVEELRSLHKENEYYRESEDYWKSTP